MQPRNAISRWDRRYIEYPYQRHDAIEARWNAIFLGERTYDPYSNGGEHQPFYLKPSEIIEAALRTPPKIKRATVSSFSDWIYSLYAPPVKIESLRLGSKMERPIFEARHHLFLERPFQEILPAGYDLVHSDLRESSIENKKFFEIPTLCVNSKPITASPDLLYINRYDNRTILVEIKHTNKAIPANLWPNVWAQLWAYSKIPIIEASPSIIAAAEIWGGDDRSIFLRRTMRRNPRDDRFDAFFSELFRIFSSH